MKLKCFKRCRKYNKSPEIFQHPITIITIITVKNGHPLSVTRGSILYIFKYKYIKIEFHEQLFKQLE